MLAPFIPIAVQCSSAFNQTILSVSPSLNQALNSLQNHPWFENHWIRDTTSNCKVYSEIQQDFKSQPLQGPLYASVFSAEFTTFCPKSFSAALGQTHPSYPIRQSQESQGTQFSPPSFLSSYPPASLPSPCLSPSSSSARLLWLTAEYFVPTPTHSMLSSMRELSSAEPMATQSSLSTTRFCLSMWLPSLSMKLFYFCIIQQGFIHSGMCARDRIFLIPQHLGFESKGKLMWNVN